MSRLKYDSLCPIFNSTNGGIHSVILCNTLLTPAIFPLAEILVSLLDFFLGDMALRLSYPLPYKSSVTPVILDHTAPVRIDLTNRGRATTTKAMATPAQMYENFRCHCGSTTYELEMSLE